MSVKLIDNDAFYGYRTRRTVNGETTQKYFSLIKGKRRLKVGGAAANRVKDLATALDKELIEKQKDYRRSSMLSEAIREDGTVKGISFLKKKEKSGNITPIFQAGVQSEVLGKIALTSFSINAHGAQEAWKRAIEFYAHHKQINKRTKIYRQMKAALPAYGVEV